MSIMVGSTNVEEGDIHQVADFIQHPSYNDVSYDYDMSILKVFIEGNTKFDKHLIWFFKIS